MCGYESGRVGVVSLLEVRKSYLGGMVKCGVRSLVRTEAGRNIMGEVDVVGLEFEQGVGVGVVRRTI